MDCEATKRNLLEHMLLDASAISCRGYLAPEFFRGEIRPEFDIYSLGVIIIEMLTGQKGYFEIKNVRI
jgi:serine/threonine protein kinase